MVFTNTFCSGVRFKVLNNIVTTDIDSEYVIRREGCIPDNLVYKLTDTQDVYHAGVLREYKDFYSLTGELYTNTPYEFIIEQQVYTYDAEGTILEETGYYFHTDDYREDFNDTDYLGNLSTNSLTGYLFPAFPMYDVPVDTDCFTVAYSYYQTNVFDLHIVTDGKKFRVAITEGTVTHNYIATNHFKETIIPDPAHDTKVMISPYNTRESVNYKIMCALPRKGYGLTPRSSKPVRWINYQAPMPKGDDADGGSQPSYYPISSVNNVSLIPGVGHQLFGVAAPIGPADISPALNYSPPSFIKSVSRTYVSGAALDATSYAVSANPSSFGYCWSSSLTPCAEQIASKTRNGYYDTWEHSLSFNNAPAPGASFYGGLQQISNLTAVTYTPEPLTRANFTGESLYFKQSGLIVTNFITCETNTYDDSLNLVGRSRYIWPERILDRNGNGLSFNYTNALFKFKNSSSAGLSTAGVKQDHGSTMLKVINAVTNEKSDIALIMQKESTPFVTSVIQKRNASAVRQPIQFTYITNRVAEAPYIINDMDVVLLSSVTFPDGKVIRYTYTNVLETTQNNTVFKLPWLNTIVTPLDTTKFEYSFYPTLEQNLYGPDERKQYEPHRVKIISNAGSSTQLFEKTGIVEFSPQAGLVETLTITDAVTTNRKSYALSLDRGTLQWIGMETANTLDGMFNNKYEFDFTRLLYTDTYSSPDNGATWFTNEVNYAPETDQITWSSDALGNESHLNYAANGTDLVEAIDPNGIITSNEYDASGNPTLSVEDTDGFRRTVSNTYNTVGQVIKSIDPLGRITRNFYSSSLSPSPPSTYASGEPQTSNFGWLNATRDTIGRVGSGVGPNYVSGNKRVKH